jgi:hypothetical protein
MSPTEKAKKLAETFVRSPHTAAGQREKRSQPKNASQGHLRKTGRPREATSMRAFAARHKVPFSTFQREVNRIRKEADVGPQGRPNYLTPYEDNTLVAYVLYMQRSSVPASREQIMRLAGQLAARRDPSIQPPSPSWYRDWIASHPYVTVAACKNVDKARKAFEDCDPDYVVQFFNALAGIVNDYNIGPSEAWNEDEAGIRIGVLYQKYHAVITHASRHERPSVSDPANRETATLIGCGNAVGDDIPPWVIFKVFPSIHWAQNDLPAGMRFARSDAAFSNAEICLDWLKHFNYYSWARSAQAQRIGKSLVEWFGFDEHGFNAQGLEAEDSDYVIRPKEEQVFRLLIIDGFSGHTTIEFLEYCIKYDIIVGIFPPHSTHLLQPLDRGVFQPMKNKHQKSVRNHIAIGEICFNRNDFIAAFKDIYEHGFTRHHIINGFEASGLYPPNPSPVLAQLAKIRNRHEEIISKGYATLLPRGDRFHEAQAGLQHIINKYSPLLSPRSYRILTDNIQQAISDGSMLNRQVNNFIRDKRQRTEAYAKTRKRGPLARPEGLFSTSLSLPELQAQFDRHNEATEKADARRQLRITINFLRTQIKEIDNNYTLTKKQEINGKMKTLTRRQWLEHTNQDMNYDMLHQTLEEHRLKWKGQADPFYLDFGAPINKEALERSLTRSNILQQMSDGVFPPSDSSIPSSMILTGSAVRSGIRDALDEARDEAYDQIDQEGDQDDTQGVENTLQTTFLPSETTLPSSPPASCRSGHL